MDDGWENPKLVSSTWKSTAFCDLNPKFTENPLFVAIDVHPINVW
jgi:hypothetical protein